MNGPDSGALFAHALTQPLTCSSFVSHAASVSAPFTFPVKVRLPISPVGVVVVPVVVGGAI